MRHGWPASVLSAAIAFAMPATANAEQTARIISPVGFVVTDSAIGAGGSSQGRTAVLMAGTRRSDGRTRPELLARVGSIRSLGRPQTLSSAAAEGLQVAVGTDGTVAAAWLEGTRGLRFATAAPGHRFGPVQRMRARTSGTTPDRVFVSGVVVTSTGRAVVVWRDGNGAVASIAERGHAFGRRKLLGASRQFRPAVTLGLGGSAVVSWIDTPPGPDPAAAPAPGAPARVMEATLLSGSKSFASPKPISSIGYWGMTTHASGTGPGGAALAWTQDGELRVSRQTETGFTTPVGMPIRPSNDRGFGVATEPNGSIVTAWGTATVGADEETVVASSVYASVLNPAGAFSLPEDFSAAGWIEGTPHAVTLRDRILVVWGVTKGSSGAVAGRVRGFGGAWVRIPSSSADRLIEQTVEAAASGAHAVVSWQTTASPSGRPSPLYLWTYDLRATGSRATAREHAPDASDR